LYYKRYIAALRQYRHRNVILDKPSREILYSFTTGDHISAYQVHSILNKSGRLKIDYINVNKKIKTLLGLNLISQSDTKNTTKAIRKPIYYRLTTGGLFNLFCWYNEMSWRNEMRGKEIFENYGENIILETLVYPYFERSTIMEFKDNDSNECITDLFYMILEYISRCSRDTEETISELDYMQVVQYIFRFSWNNLKPRAKLYLLQQVLNLNCSEIESKKGLIDIENGKVNGRNKRKSIKISWGNKLIFANLDQRNRHTYFYTYTNANIKGLIFFILFLSIIINIQKILKVSKSKMISVS
jgi:hypothetical protein